MEIWLGKRNERELVVRFGYHVEWWNRMVRFGGSRWLPKERVWIIPYTMQQVERFIDLFRDVEVGVSQDLQAECYLLSPNSRNKEVMDEDHRKVDLENSHWSSYVESKLIFELKVRGYSMRTIRAYCGHVERFYRYYEQNRKLSSLDLMPSYSHHLLSDELSHSYVNQAISAIKFYLDKVCGMQGESFPYVRPKKEQKLPNVLGQNEVLRLLSVVENRKHRAIFYIIYSSGLRVGEVVRLKVADMDRERKTLHIRQGKGKKDRITILSDAAVEVINQYILMYKPEVWLFPGQDSKGHLTERTVQKVFEQAVKASKIDKAVSVHSLRHSFATHLLEEGIDIRYIQELLGHRSIQTTEIYTHVAVKDVRKIVSPLDRIMKKQDN
ncbi:site-specific tyrosine recombinase/integron integrase [Cohnella lupini]|uniref:Site-specific recombinase XerD n=1 Tax=Cohnella lupini TaxID=1294267 RepID=A0A3D9IX90_9BACL|nr:site-specific tyrosine recombinase/integron integrase [Cohnella lupini]RED66119.1 site-specific recombinase XerD [Cohnella lupini]